MACFTLREFKCDLCGQTYLWPSGDLVVPMPVVCDLCLSVVWDLEGEALVQHITECLQANLSQQESPPKLDQAPVEGLVKYVQEYQARWANVQEVIRNREQHRRMFGG